MILEATNQSYEYHSWWGCPSYEDRMLMGPRTSLAINFVWSMIRKRRRKRKKKKGMVKGIVQN